MIHFPFSIFHFLTRLSFTKLQNKQRLSIITQDLFWMKKNLEQRLTLIIDMLIRF